MLSRARSVEKESMWRSANKLIQPNESIIARDGNKKRSL